ncbi:MAG: tRNA dihydrouridine(20/20a) synthase DusA [Burkholderiales bacterium]|nr:MAG: tRNA dihydrouridine(20/20a) synthase DusA [Burkholderiales bacterium]
MPLNAATERARLSTAPMMDRTDRHCRFFHRLLAPTALLYTEMVTTGALIHGDQPRHLDFDPSEHPVALQLGGSEPEELAHCAHLAEGWGYDEINLNCGCPSERVQRGAFGACLMAEPALVADCVRAMRDACGLPVTVKHRIGLGRNEDYGFVGDFVGTVAAAGCERFIVHARNAWLEGLSPKQNREVPPLRYDVVYRLVADFPSLRFVLNGGLRSAADVLVQHGRVDGVMIGRAAYQEPYLLPEFEAASRGERAVPITHADRAAVVETMREYASVQVSRGVPLRAITRHMLGLFNGLPGARRWRQQLSDADALQAGDVDLLLRALPRPVARAA